MSDIQVEKPWNKQDAYTDTLGHAVTVSNLLRVRIQTCVKQKEREKMYRQLLTYLRFSSGEMLQSPRFDREEIEKVDNILSGMPPAYSDQGYAYLNKVYLVLSKHINVHGVMEAKPKTIKAEDLFV